MLPDELEALPAVLEQAGFPVSGLLATHADWDHLLGRLALPGAALGVAESSALRLREGPGDAQRSLREFDDEHYVSRPAPLALGSVQALPVPGKLSLGERQELDVHAGRGHTADGAIFSAPWLGLLVCGDYLSPVEIPMISTGGSLEEYLATLRTLEALLEHAELIVPGHGHPLPREQAQQILAEDRAYLEALRAGRDPPLPRAHGSKTQRQIHARNLI